MVVTPSFGVMPNFGGAMRDAYGAAQDRAQQQREIQYRDTRRRGAEAYGQHIAGGDYESAATVAGKLGDAEGATQARTMGREEAWRTAEAFHTELQTIASMSNPTQQRTAYNAWYLRALRLAEEHGMLTPEARASFEAGNPPPDAPDLAARLPQAVAQGRAQLRSQAQRGGSSSDWLERDDTERARNQIEWTPDDYGTMYGQNQAGQLFRRGEDGTPQEVQNIPQRAPVSNNGGAGYGPSGMTAENIRLEREFSRDWRGVYTNWSEINNEFGRIQQMAARADSAGDLALVVSFTKMLDPGSVAREGEVALTQRAASILGQVQNMPQQWVDGRTLLPPAVRAQLLSAAREMHGVYQGAYQILAEDYRRNAERYGFDESVMMGYRPASGGGGGGGGGGAQRPPGVPADAVQDPETGEWVEQ